MLNPFKRIAELEARVEQLEQSVNNRFAVVMNSNKRIHGTHAQLMKHQERLSIAIKEIKASKESK